MVRKWQQTIRKNLWCLTRRLHVRHNAFVVWSIISTCDVDHSYLCVTRTWLICATHPQVWHRDNSQCAIRITLCIAGCSTHPEWTLDARRMMKVYKNLVAPISQSSMLFCRVPATGPRRRWRVSAHAPAEAEPQAGDGTATYSRCRYLASASIRCPQYAVQVKLHDYVVNADFCNRVKTLWMLFHESCSTNHVISSL